MKGRNDTRIKRWLYHLHVRYRNWRYNEFNAPSIPLEMYRNFQHTETGFSIEVCDRRTWHKVPESDMREYDWTTFTCDKGGHNWFDSKGANLMAATDIDCFVAAMIYHKEWIPFKKEEESEV